MVSLRKQSKHNFVFWLDDDMLGTPSHVAFLREAARYLNAAVTGIYCKRCSSSELTVKLYPREETRSCHVGDVEHGDGVVFPSHPVCSGMGCLMVPVEQFKRYADGVPHFARVGDGKDTEPVPGICASGMAQDESGQWVWLSEDQTYCEGLWCRENGVWTAPIGFAHLSEVPLRPSLDAVWLGEKPATSLTIDPVPLASLDVV
jgi:hypothetical protein